MVEFNEQEFAAILPNLQRAIQVSVVSTLRKALREDRQQGRERTVNSQLAQSGYGAPFVKAELKRADVTYAELAERLKAHGLPGETEASIKAKLKRGTFAATFFLAVLAALELEGVQLGDL